jgi:hypothetical protein
MLAKLYPTAIRQVIAAVKNLLKTREPEFVSTYKAIKLTNCLLTANRLTLLGIL